MSITDELRKHVTNDKLHYLSDYIAIADRIDAEHERVRAESIIDITDESMAEHGWVRLPKDADGECIHIGDVMESKGSGLLFGEDSFEVRTMRYDEYGWEVYDRLGDCYAPSLLCHYHAPTVEDVLREFAEGLGVPVADSYIAASAAKLQLRED